MTEVTNRALAERFDRKRAAHGLQDIKFLISINDETTSDSAAGDVEQFYTDIDAGNVAPLDFHDLRWREI